jgi:hypothetical protein
MLRLPESPPHPGKVPAFHEASPFSGLFRTAGILAFVARPCGSCSFAFLRSNAMPLDLPAP